MTNPASAKAKANIAAVGPRRPPAAATRRIPLGAVARYALDEYLETGGESRVVLCPSGRDLEEDLAFLRTASRRLLWPAPPRAIADAIEGLLSETRRARLPAPARRGGRSSQALLLEGEVTRARARAALDSPVRLGIVENVARVR